MAVVIAGDRSGVGKTTVTLALLAALRQRGLAVQSFKVGPDYIDPMFHQFITHRPCRNLDPVLTSDAYVQQSFIRHTRDVKCAVVEGVMGLFDGASATDDVASTAHIAHLLNCPILLVLDCARLSRSIAAIAHGYTTFDPRLQFAGIVLNRVGSDRHLDLLKAALEPLHIPILGVLRRQDDITIPDRHLGLIPTDELPHLSALVDRLAHLGETVFSWSALLPWLSSPVHPSAPNRVCPSTRTAIRLAVARDRAFSFYYPDNLEQLEALGAELVYWSPLEEVLPEAIGGMYFGGGFPEVFADALADNTAALKAVRGAILAGMPTYAECGGLMYLSDRLIDFDRRSWAMVGVLPTTPQMGNRLTLGYRKAIARRSTPLLPQGATVWGHEFHRSTLMQEPAHPLYDLSTWEGRPLQGEGWASATLHASYVHLHWGNCPEWAARFVSQCVQFRGQQHDTDGTLA